MSNQEVCKKSTSKNVEWGIAVHRYQLTRDVIIKKTIKNNFVNWNESKTIYIYIYIYIYIHSLATLLHLVSTGLDPLLPSELP